MLFFLLAIVSPYPSFAADPSPGRDWPAKPGDAAICTWKNDALAAISITIDDNGAPFHAWWLEMTEKYNFKVTWFVITGSITDNETAYWGSWAAFQKLANAGHDIQSHTVTHLHTESPLWKGIEADYTDSQKAIQEHIPGSRCLTLAYPGGKNTDLNDTPTAAKYFIGARGTKGSLNALGKTDYMKVNSLGDINLQPRFASQGLDNLFNSASPFYRGWYCSHFHGIKPEIREDLENKFKVLRSRMDSNDLWCGLFREICQYGQERDSAKVEIKENTPDKITLTLTDSLDDARFDFPLTLKVRLAPGWKQLRAQQGGSPVPATLTTHEGGDYAQVQAVPDRGEISLTHGP